MKELEKLTKKGWRFSIWLSPAGVCIIQGKFGDEDGFEDWDFDVNGGSFGVAVKLALNECRERASI